MDTFTFRMHTSSHSVKTCTPSNSSQALFDPAALYQTGYHGSQTPMLQRQPLLLLFQQSVCVCVLPGAEFRRRAAEADHGYLQGGGAGMLGGRAERPGRQQRGAQGRAEPPAETQRGARSTGHRVLLLITLLILADRRQLLHQAAVAFPVHLRDGGNDQSLKIVTQRQFCNVLVASCW